MKNSIFKGLLLIAFGLGGFQINVAAANNIKCNSIDFSRTAKEVESLKSLSFGNELNPSFDSVRKLLLESGFDKYQSLSREELTSLLAKQFEGTVNKSALRHVSTAADTIFDSNSFKTDPLSLFIGNRNSGDVRLLTRFLQYDSGITHIHRVTGLDRINEFLNHYYRNIEKIEKGHEELYSKHFNSQQSALTRDIDARNRHYGKKQLLFVATLALPILAYLTEPHWLNSGWYFGYKSKMIYESGIDNITNIGATIVAAMGAFKTYVGIKYATGKVKFNREEREQYYRSVVGAGLEHTRPNLSWALDTLTRKLPNELKQHGSDTYFQISMRSAEKLEKEELVPRMEIMFYIEKDTGLPTLLYYHYGTREN